VTVAVLKQQDRFAAFGGLIDSNRGRNFVAASSIVYLPMSGGRAARCQTKTPQNMLMKIAGSQR
jgi:hypothetical protein